MNAWQIYKFHIIPYSYTCLNFPSSHVLPNFDQALLSLSTILIILHSNEVTKITIYELQKIILFISTYWKVTKTSSW
jgi:hypothetical protein